MPLFFLPFTVEVFEMNKGYLLLSLTALGFFSWLGQMVFKEKKLTFRNSRLDLFVLGFLVVSVLSTIFAKGRAVSLFGAYGRFWPSLIGILSMGAFYFLLTNNLKEGGVKLTKILKVFMVSCLLVAFIGLFSFLGGPNVLNRILTGVSSRIALPGVVLLSGFNPVAGSVEGLAVFLSFAIVLAISSLMLKKIEGKAWTVLGYLLVFGSFVILAVVDFWPAWLALCLSLLVFLVFSFSKRIFKEEINLLAVPIFVCLLAALFIFYNPLTSALPEGSRITSLPSEVLLKQGASWQLALEGTKARPVLGSGLGNFSYAFSRFKPASFLGGSLWQLRLNKSGSFIAESIMTMGVLGVLAWLALLGFFFYRGYSVIKKKDRTIVLGLVAAGVALLVGQFVYYQNIVLAFSIWLVLALGAVAYDRELKTEKVKEFPLKDFPEIGLVFSVFFWIVLVAFGFFGFTLAKGYLADVYYRDYLRDPVGGLTKLEKASQLADHSIYPLILSRAYLNNFINEINASEPDSQRAAEMARLAVEEAKKASERRPYDVASQETLALVYQSISPVAPEAIDWALRSYEGALDLEPKNPAYLLEIARLKISKEQTEEAIDLLNEAIKMKEDYPDAYLVLSALKEREGEKDAAREILEQLINKNPWSLEGNFQLGRIYYNEGQYDLAEQRFINALQLFPNHSNSLYSLGLLYEREGDEERAIAAFERVLQLNPDNEDIKQRLARLKGKQGVVPQEEPLQEEEPESIEQEE